MFRFFLAAWLMLILASASAVEPSARKEPSAEEPSTKQPLANLTAGETAAQVCSGCHGVSSELPNLETYTVAQIETLMLAFKSQQRESTLMVRLAKGYSDSEIRSMAIALGRK